MRANAVDPRRGKAPVDEGHDSGLPDNRAPWERPIADPTFREAPSGHRRRSRARRADIPADGARAGGAHSEDARSRGAHSAEAQSEGDHAASRRDSGRNRRAADAGDPERLTVADLVDKVSRRDGSPPPTPTPTPTPP
ncbi:hypothetical protein TVH25_19990, partial [Rhodococcus sp. 7Tela_A2]